MPVGSQRKRTPLSPRALKEKARQYEFGFWRERTAWPFVHAVLPLALYALSRNFVLALLLIYVWETIETAASIFIKALTENKYDALIGDPIIGALAITTLFVLDCAFNWRDAFCAAVPLGLRIGAFLVLWLVTGLAFAYEPRLHDMTWRVVWPAPAIALLYAATLLIFFNRVVFRAASADEVAAGTSVLVWLLLMALLAAAATLAPPSQYVLSSTFLRVLLAELVLLVGALIALAAASA